MLSIFYALGPIFALILLGQAMKRSSFVGESFWPNIEKLTYYVTFPALLCANLAKADLTSLPWEWIAASIILATLASGALSLFLQKTVMRPDKLPQGKATVSSAFQGSVRMNTYVGLAAASALYGQTGITIIALCIAATVPLVNVMSVSALTHLVPKGRSVGIGSVVLGIIKNPIIIGCAIGITVNLVGWSLPPILGPLLEILGRAALPMGLLAVGAGLSLTVYGGVFEGEPPRVMQILSPLLCSMGLKLVFLPFAAGVFMLLASAVAPLFGGDPLPPEALPMVVLWGGLPTASSAYVLARQMGGDAPMMAAIITWQTLAAMLTLPMLLGILQILGLS